MARAFGKLLSRIWDDPDFLALEVGPQRLYGFLVSQANLSHAGLLPLTLRKWSKKAKGLTIADLEKDLAVLDDARFVVLDEGSEELLIRTYIRNDDVYKMPRVMGAAVSDAQEIESLRLRRALLAEIDRLPLDELSEEPTKGRDGRPGPSIRAQVDTHIRALRVAFAGVRPAPATPSATPYGRGSGHFLQLPAQGVAEPPAEPLPEPLPEGVAEGVKEGVEEPLPEGVGEGDAEGVYARGRGPAHPRTSPTPTPAPSPSPSPTPSPTPPPTAAPGSTADSPSESHQSGRGEGEEDDPNYAAALAVVAELPPEMRPSRGSADRLIDAVAEVLRLGWPAAELTRRMTAEPPDQIRSLVAFLLQRLPPAEPYQPPQPAAHGPHVTITGRQMCPVHTYIELTNSGTCPNCAADAKVAANVDDLDQRLPVAARQDSPPPARSFEDRAEDRAEVIAARRVLDALKDREQWLEKARKHLAETGDTNPVLHYLIITAAHLYQAATSGCDPDSPPEEG